MFYGCNICGCHTGQSIHLSVRFAELFFSYYKSFEIMYDLIWITITEIWAEFEAVEREFETPAHFDSLSKKNIIANRFDISQTMTISFVLFVQVFYAGKSFTAVQGKPSKKQKVKDQKRLTDLFSSCESRLEPSSLHSKRPTSQIQSARVMLMKDAERMQKLTGCPATLADLQLG